MNARMILPVLDAGTTDHWRDARLPRPYAGFDGPTAVDHHHRTAECPDGRHLWDLIQTSGAYRPIEDQEGVDGALEVRLTGTCVRCGVIWRLEGAELDRQHRSPGRLNPTPLQAAGLRAQETDHFDSYGLREASSTYSVHAGSDPAVIGWISWGRGPRGREFYTGRLSAWPAGQTVEATTPAAVLRKLARGGGDRG